VKEAITIEEIKDKLAPLLAEEDLEIVLLFGSAASGRMHKRSDLDLAFLFEKPVDILSLTNRVIRLLHTDSVDVVDLRRASPLLRYSAAKNGRLLYEKREGLFNSFYSLASRMYIDTKKLRDAQKVGIAQYLRARGMS
jgi:predicted nucleotidyltransferase